MLGGAAVVVVAGACECECVCEYGREYGVDV